MALAHRASDTVAAPDREAAPDQAAITAFGAADHFMHGGVIKLSHHLWPPTRGPLITASLDCGPFLLSCRDPNRGAGCDCDCACDRYCDCFDKSHCNCYSYGQCCSYCGCTRYDCSLCLSTRWHP